ncbi:Melanocortin receptor 5 [Desmophyllum pertusum]|uniref:Melanocortin receptor 5 n=1 Tax=Desmophyllum pertusum TaxID=174260 RepID=A0A9W9Z1M8_9CNID|nr:Melanocortin receptor 5 [Desmophyllum pertusum]
MTKNGSFNTTGDLSDIEATFLASMNLLFSLFGIFGNVLVFIVVVRNRQLHTVTNMFITSLALADLLVCLVAQPMYVIFLFGLPPNPAYGNTRKTFFLCLRACIDQQPGCHHNRPLHSHRVADAVPT